MYRGFDPYLVSRVARTGSHYLDHDTLKEFDAFGCAVYTSMSARVVVMVESVADAYLDIPREYRAVAFVFDSVAGTVRVLRSPHGGTRYRADKVARDVAARITADPAMSDKDIATAIGDDIAAYL